jgi:transposase
MRKFIEVVRLHSFGLTQRQIARSCSIAQSTVNEYLKAAAEAGLSWPLPPGWNDQELERALSQKPRLSAKVRQAVPPDISAVRKQLQTHRNLTLQLLWEEYREGNPEGYSYSRFCELYRDWARTLDVVLRHEHRAGEKMFVDYAGDKIPVHDRKTGEVLVGA